MPDAIADVGDGAGQRHHGREISEAAKDLYEIQMSAARRNRLNPIAVKSMLGIHAQSAAN